ncbi:MAG: nitrate/nitrite transporter NarK [Myxococcota bacterium]
MGGWVAARVGASRPVLLAMIIGVLSLLAGVANMMMIKLPTWMFVEVPLYLVVAFAAGKHEERRRASLLS